MERGWIVHICSRLRFHKNYCSHLLLLLVACGVSVKTFLITFVVCTAC